MYQNELSVYIYMHVRRTEHIPSFCGYIFHTLQTTHWNKYIDNLQHNVVRYRNFIFGNMKIKRTAITLWCTLWWIKKIEKFVNKKICDNTVRDLGRTCVTWTYYRNLPNWHPTCHNNVVLRLPAAASTTYHIIINRLVFILFHKPVIITLTIVSPIDLSCVSI